MTIELLVVRPALETQSGEKVVIKNTSRSVLDVLRTGPQGIQGAQGPTGPMGVGYLHSQPSAASTWIINHNLGFKPAVSVYTVGGLEIVAEIIHISNNQCQAIFVENIAGFAQVN